MMNNSIVNKVKSNWAAITLVIVLVGLVLGYYFIQQTNREGFSDESDASDALIGQPPNLKPKSGECIVALFYADWCPHCVKFKPHFEEAMEKMNGKMRSGKRMKLVKVDCDKYKELAKEYDVAGYPTVKLINDDGTTAEYEGDRTFEGLRKYLVTDN
jgi:thiol-disulfide isomerase/thioredoxin